MKLTEYAAYDALGLADLVAKKQVSAKELAQTAAVAIDAINPMERSGSAASRVEGFSTTALMEYPVRSPLLRFSV
jgi:hypothetical protein